MIRQLYDLVISTKGNSLVSAPVLCELTLLCVSVREQNL